MLINKYYAEDNDGVTLEEAEDYQATRQYENRLKQLRFSLGGVVPKPVDKKPRTRGLASRR